MTSLDAVLFTQELTQRVGREPDFKTESMALSELAEVMARRPEDLLQRLVDVALRLCGAGSAGLSLLEMDGLVRWRATTGVFAPHVGGTMPLDASPCGETIRRDAALLFKRPERYYAYPVDVDPPMEEALLVPFRECDRPSGTLWVIMHSPGRRFDAEHARVLSLLANFAGAGLHSAAWRQSEERLRLALQAARMGIWTWQVAADMHSRDANLNRLLDLPAEATCLPIEDFFSHVHEHDRTRVRETFRRAVLDGRNMHVDFRVVWPDGSVHWLSDQGDVFGAGDERYLAGACIDVTERKELEERLRDADQRKDEFLAMLGHELRNPLAPLRNVVDTLQGHGLAPAQQLQAYAVMDRQIGQLTRLVNDLLDVFRITLGRIDLSTERVDLATVAELAVETAAPVLESRGHELTVSTPRKPLWIEGDPARLTQVIFNLLNNAAKYTPPGGHVRLSLEREEGWAVVRVRDNGAGMTKDLVPRVFDLFAQGTRTLDRSQGGLGLGLALVKRLVVKHGGTVHASSDGPGHGSEFVVRLPARTDEAAKPTSTNPPTRPSAVLAGYALVVDDVPDIADSYAWLLQGLVTEVKVAYGGAQAIDMAKERVPVLVLCDLGMPGLDGYETCRLLRALPQLATTVIAAVSGYGGEEYQHASERAGFDHHLVKPVSRAAIEQLVKGIEAG